MSSVLPTVLLSPGSFAGLPSKCDFLENSLPGLRYLDTGVSANPAGSVVK